MYFYEVMSELAIQVALSLKKKNTKIEPYGTVPFTKI